MKVSMGQLAATSDKAENLATIAALTEQAAADGSELVVFPEFAMYEQAGVDRGFVDAAEPLDGPFTRAIGDIAQHNGVAIVAGMLEAIPNEDRAYNTLFVSDAHGVPIAHYRKVHLYDAFGIRESDIIKPAEDLAPTTFQIGGVRVGLMTCYDLRFPEQARELADAGVQLTLLPSSWTPGPRKEDHWNVLSRARAIENTMYFLAVSQAPPLGTGGSLLVDPMGVVVGEIGEQVAVVTFEVDPLRVDEVRLRNPSLAMRRYAVIGRRGDTETLAGKAM